VSIYEVRIINAEICPGKVTVFVLLGDSLGPVEWRSHIFYDEELRNGMIWHKVNQAIVNDEHKNWPRSAPPDQLVHKGKLVPGLAEKKAELESLFEKLRMKMGTLPAKHALGQLVGRSDGDAVFILNRPALWEDLIVALKRKLSTA